jgi:NTP pyrophosphatase (non-canonical NTP hydrolase)
MSELPSKELLNLHCDHDRRITEDCPECAAWTRNSRAADLAEEVRAELSKAVENWPAFNSAHEGYAVLAEEVDELWAHVKTNQKRRDLVAMRKEAVQCAAMAMRFALEVCDEKNGRK